MKTLFPRLFPVTRPPIVDYLMGSRHPELLQVVILSTLRLDGPRALRPKWRADDEARRAVSYWVASRHGSRWREWLYKRLGQSARHQPPTVGVGSVLGPHAVLVPRDATSASSLAGIDVQGAEIATWRLPSQARY